MTTSSIDSFENSGVFYSTPMVAPSSERPGLESRCCHEILVCDTCKHNHRLKTAGDDSNRSVVHNNIFFQEHQTEIWQSQLLEYSAGRIPLGECSILFPAAVLLRGLYAFLKKIASQVKVWPKAKIVPLTSLVSSARLATTAKLWSAEMLLKTWYWCQVSKWLIC